MKLLLVDKLINSRINLTILFYNWIILSYNDKLIFVFGISKSPLIWVFTNSSWFDLTMISTFLTSFGHIFWSFRQLALPPMTTKQLGCHLNTYKYLLKIFITNSAINLQFVKSSLSFIDSFRKFIVIFLLMES